MEQIDIIFFVIGTFLGNPNPVILSEQTSVTVDPANRQMEVVLDRLFYVQRAAVDSTTAAAELSAVTKMIETDSVVSWTEDLAMFTDKKLERTVHDDRIQFRLRFTYEKPVDLRVFGIWYDAEKNSYSINQVPQLNISTETGELGGNYYRFAGDTAFTFTVQPFRSIPPDFARFKRDLESLAVDE